MPKHDPYSIDPAALAASIRELAAYVEAHADDLTGVDLGVELNVHPQASTTIASYTATANALGLPAEEAKRDATRWRQDVPWPGVEVTVFGPRAKAVAR